MADGDSEESLDSIRKRKAEELQAAVTAPSKPVDVENAAQLEELLSKHTPVLVDFHADWCGPCKMLEPTVTSVAARTSGTVAKVDVDAHQDVARQNDVSGVPTLDLFVDGDHVERLVGVQDESTLTDLVEAHT